MSHLVLLPLAFSSVYILYCPTIWLCHASDGRLIFLSFSLCFLNVVSPTLHVVSSTTGAFLGLAAPQVHASKRVCIVNVPYVEEDFEEDRIVVLLNARYKGVGTEKENDLEGCFSSPGLVGEVPRFKRIRYTATLLDGSRVEVDADGLHGRVVQHEIDHLDGIVYPMRMESDNFRKFGWATEMQKRM